MISSSLLRFLELFSCSLAHPHIFLVFTSYQIPSHLVIKISPGLQPMSPSTHWPRVLLRWLKSRSILCYRGIDRTEVHWTTHTHDSESYEYRITQSLYVWDTPWESSQHPSHILLLHPSWAHHGNYFLLSINYWSVLPWLLLFLACPLEFPSLAYLFTNHNLCWLFPIKVWPLILVV